MSLDWFRSRCNVLAPLLLVAILFAQGLRLCLHAPHEAEAGHVHTTALHIENDLLAEDDSNDTTGDRHVPISLAFIKKLANTVLWVVPVAAALLFVLPRVASRPLAEPQYAFPFAGHYRRRPPLRAPPR